MRTLVIIALLFCSLGVISLKAQKTAVHWYLPTMSITEAHQLDGYNLVIVDPEVIFNNRESLETLRADNPEVKIFCYFNAVEWFNPMFSDKRWSQNIVNFLDKKEEWFLHAQNGERISFWKGMETMNCRLDCPRLPVYSKDKTINYIEFITDRFIKDILKNYRFDGVLMDNLWDKIHWLGNYGDNTGGLDYGSDLADNDSVALNLEWQRGMNYCLDEINEFGGAGYLIGNPGHLNYPQCSGKMFENFPEIYLNEADRVYEAWPENINNASVFATGPNIFNARKDNYFFTLCSSLLVDNVYFSYLQNTKYDSKYELDLGPAIGEMKVDKGIYSRRFRKGTVNVNPLHKKAWVTYNDWHKRTE